MKNITVPFTLLLTCACNYVAPDPCTNSLLLPGLTSEQADACEECGAPSCEGAGETGDDGPVDLFCSTVFNINTTPIENGEQLCIVGTEPWDEPANGWQWGEQVSSATCQTAAGPFPCNRSWVSPWDGDDECMMCNLPLTDHNVHQPAYTGTVWRMCSNGGNGWPYWPATTYDVLGDDDLQDYVITPDWYNHTYCGTDQYIGSCEPVLMSPHRSQDEDTLSLLLGEWTCKCESDADCLIGSVCEAGWVIEGGIPHPTLCTWDEGLGGAPAGPEVYGVQQWGEGITIDDDRVTMTPAFFVALVGHVESDQSDRIIGVGLLNDDQAFGAGGMVEHCGPDSLCALIGLNVGDIVQAEPRHSDALAAGETVVIDVVSPDGAVRQLSVSVTSR